MTNKELRRQRKTELMDLLESRMREREQELARHEAVNNRKDD